MSDFKSKLEALKDSASEVAEQAGKLRNQNLADIVRLGIARIEQALGHPDIDRLDADEDQQNSALGHEPLNSGGNMMFSAGDPGRTLQNEEANRRAVFEAGAAQPAQTPAPGAPFPGTTEGGAPVQDATKLDPDAKHPGDPSFVKPNADFKDPNAVNLNDDGTAKVAPNSFGASDERDGGKKE